MILLAFKLGILASAKVPALVLLAFKFGILASARVPEFTLDAAIEPLKFPAFNVLLFGLYVKLLSTATCFADPEASVNVRNLFAFAEL